LYIGNQKSRLWAGYEKSSHLKRVEMLLIIVPLSKGDLQVFHTALIMNFQTDMI
jgi:hypothetical protein